MDLLVIFWVPLVVAAILGGSVSFRSGPEGSARVLAPTTRPLLGVLLIVVGMVTTLAGFGSMWVVSIEGRSELPGAVVFFAGGMCAFGGIALINGRARSSAED